MGTGTTHDQPRPVFHRWNLIGAAPGRTPVLLAGIVVLPLIVSVLVALTSGHHLYPWADHAVVETETVRAGRGHQLLGTYSRYGWSHPGPVLFYLLVPLYWLSGHSTTGLSAGAAALNLLWVGTIVLVTARLAGTRGALWAAFLSAGYLAVLGPRVARDFWIPHTVMLSFGAYLVACAGLAAGRVALLPLVIGLASFLAETDVSVAPATGGVLLAALVLFALSRRRAGAQHPPHARGWRALWPCVGALALAALIWWPPVQQQLTGSPGNFTLMRDFFQQGYVSHSLSEAKSAVANALASLPFGLPKGDLAAPASHGRQLFAALVVVLLVAGAAVGWRRRRTFAFSLCALALVGVAAEVYAATKVRGEMFTYLFDWVSGISLAGWLGIGLALGPEAGALRGRLRASPRAVTGVTAALALGLAALAVNNLAQTARAGSLSADPAFHDPVTKPLDLQTEAWLRSHGYHDPLVMIPDNAQWPWAATTVDERYKHSRPVAVDDNYLFMFGSQLAPTGDEDVSLYYVARGQHGLIPAARRWTLVAQLGQTAVYAVPAAQ